MRFPPILAGLLLVLALAIAPPAAAETEQQMLINRAAATVGRVMADPQFQDQGAALLTRARAVLVVPHLVKAGFILGGEYGNGVLLVRGRDGAFGPPAFYTMGSGSLGLQAGMQESEVIFLVMTETGLDAVMRNRFKMGADASVALMTDQVPLETTAAPTLGSDIVAFSRSVGLFGGGALEGAVIRPRSTWNAAYYGTPVPPEAIVLDGVVTNPQADDLRRLLGR